MAHLKPSNFNNKSCFLGIAKVLILILLFGSLKSAIKWTVAFFLGIMKDGAAHSELLLRFNTPIIINLLTSVFIVSSCILGIGKGLVWIWLNIVVYFKDKIRVQSNKILK